MPIHTIYANANTAVFIITGDENMPCQCELADGSVTEPKLADGAVTSWKIADGSVGWTKLQEQSVAEQHLQNGAVSTDKIKNRTITANKLSRRFTGYYSTDVSIEQLMGDWTTYELRPNNITPATIDFTLNEDEYATIYSAAYAFHVTAEADRAGLNKKYNDVQLQLVFTLNGQEQSAYIQNWRVYVGNCINIVFPPVRILTRLFGFGNEALQITNVHWKITKAGGTSINPALTYFLKNMQMTVLVS